LNGYVNECGCSLGAICMLISFFVGIFALTMRYAVLSAAFLWHLPLIVVVALVGAGLGKVFALKRARRQLHNAVRDLIASQNPT